MVSLCIIGWSLNYRGLSNMEATWMLEIIVGAGIVGMLWKMSHQIGCLTVEMKRTNDLLSDHEERIRKLER